MRRSVKPAVVMLCAGLATGLAADRACGQWLDTFDRANGGLGPDWVASVGSFSNFNVVGGRVLHAPVATNEMVRSTTALGNYAKYSQTIDVFRNTNGPEMVGLAAGLGGTQNMFVGVQTDPRKPDFARVSFCRGANDFAGWPGGEPAGQTMDASFTSARMQVYFTNPDTVNVVFDTNFDGVPDLTYQRSGVAAFASGAFGNQFGVGALNGAGFDNWVVTPSVVPPAPHAGGDALMFDPGSFFLLHQVFRSGLWTTPVRIREVRFAPTSAGTYSLKFEWGILLGYTLLAPGVNPPAGLDVPEGVWGEPNSVGNLTMFNYSFGGWSQSIVTPGAEDFQLAFPAKSQAGFVYFPGVGNLLVSMYGQTGAQTMEGTVSLAIGGADSSRAYTSPTFGRIRDTTSAYRVEFVAMPVNVDVLPTFSELDQIQYPYGSSIAVDHQVHHRATLAPLGAGGSGKVAIQGIAYAPCGDGHAAGDVTVRMGYSARVPGLKPPEGLDVPAAGGGGAPNAVGAMSTFYSKRFDQVFTGASRDNFQMLLHQTPFVFDPAVGNLLIETPGTNLGMAVWGVPSLFAQVPLAEADRATLGGYWGTRKSLGASTIKFFTTPVSENVYPTQDDRGWLLLPFGHGNHTEHQVFSSALFGNKPVRIDAIAFAPVTDGAYDATEVTVRMGYSARVPNQNPPAGLSPPVGGDGLPNAALHPMTVFRSGPYSRTFVNSGRENYQLELTGDSPFLYNPAMGDLLVEYVTSVPNTTVDELTWAWDSATSESSTSVWSDRFGVQAFPNYTNRVKFTYFEDLYPCAADLTGEGTVDLLDFFGFFNCWDESARCADLDGSGSVDLLDFFAFFNAWDGGC